jgi:hypothetical protein
MNLVLGYRCIVYGGTFPFLTVIERIWPVSNKSCPLRFLCHCSTDLKLRACGQHLMGSSSAGIVIPEKPSQVKVVL